MSGRVTEWSDVSISSGSGPAPEVPAGLDLAALRQTYETGALEETTVGRTWLEQFTRWFAQAQDDDAIVEPNAMQLATADADGLPSVRTVLAKTIDPRGVVFYTNYDSPKGRDLGVTPYAAVVFAWLPQQRQVRFSGPTVPVERAETEHYFAQRPRGSQLGAWTSAQSTVVADREALDDAEAEMGRRFAGIEQIPPPPRWGGYRLRPLQVEFWQGRRNRLHDRLRFRRDDVASERWQLDRLAP